MATVKSDIIEGNNARYGAKGWEINRVITVSGLVAANGHGRLKEAVDGCGVALWDVHPTVTTAKAIEFRPRALSTDVVEVTVVYRTSTPHFSLLGDDAQIEVGGAVQQTTELFDVNGNDVTVTYTIDGNDVSIVPPMAVMRPHFTARFSRKESSSPAWKSYLYVGKVNNSNWTVDPTADARTYLCTSIMGRSTDGGDTYQVEYEFEYKDDGYCGNWDSFVNWQNSDGTIPADNAGNCLLVEGTGYRCVQNYTEVDFNPLDLPAI